MLEQGGVGRPVHVTEVEQALPDVRRHLETGVRQVEAAQRARLGVGHPQTTAVRTRREAARLGEPGVVGRAVADPFLARAGQDGDGVQLRPFAEVQHPQLMRAGHRDGDPVDPPRQIPRPRECLTQRGATALTLAQLLPGAGHGANPPVAQPDRLDLVVDAVGHEDVVPGACGHLGR